MAFTTESVLDMTALPDKVRREVPRVMNRLLGGTFLYQGDEANKEDYYLVYRHRGVLRWRACLASANDGQRQRIHLSPGRI